MDELNAPQDSRPSPPPGWSLTQMPNGALILESPARTGIHVTAQDEHPHSMMLWRLLSAMKPNREPIK